MRHLLALSLLALSILRGAESVRPAIPGGAPATSIEILRVERLASGVRYGLVGSFGDKPAPTLFVFQGDLDTVRQQPLYIEVARILARQGFLGVVLDAPAHGEDRRPNDPTELAAWRTRVDRGENLLDEFLVRSRAVLDHLIQSGQSDPSRLAAVGTSRGGFLAFHFAAAEPRIRCVGGIAPVTDLLALREFNGITRLKAAQDLALIHLAAGLANRPVWLSIGNRDERVSTEATITFSRALVAAAAPEAAAPVTLLVHSGSGHRSSPEDHERLAAWLLEQPPFLGSKLSTTSPPSSTSPALTLP